MAAGPTRRYRFVPADRYDGAAADPDLASLREQARLTGTARRALGDQRLAELLDLAVSRVPAYATVNRGELRERGLAGIPPVTKAGLRSGTGRLATGAVVNRWNRTSGSTNAPLRTPLGDRHEDNQIVRWLRHWPWFGVTEPAEVCFLVPRSYRLRVFGGGTLLDLAGGHVVHQRHPSGSEPQPPGRVVVANPHVLERLYPAGWPERLDALVTSYEQRPTGLYRWPAAVYGDVYGLSEVGDVAFQRAGDTAWQLHDDLVRCEILDGRQHGDLLLGELAVTDLTNHVMPLLRYRTGDLVAGRCDAGGQIIELVAVVGRRILTAGTPLAGVDVMSALVPALLDADLPFRVAAGPRRVAVHVQAGEPELGRLRRRLATSLPGVPVTVTGDRAELAGLRDVFAPPDPSGFAASATAPRPCRCQTGSGGLTRLGDLMACRDGGSGTRLVCLPPGPGFGHQIIRDLHRVLAGLGDVRLVEYPGHGYGAPPADVEALVDAVAEAVRPDDVLLGHSWGARIAAAVAATHRVAGLVLLSPPPATRATRHWNGDTARLRQWRRDGLDPDRWYRRYLEDYAIPLGMDGDRTRARRLLHGVTSHEPAWRRLRHESAAFDLPATLTRVSAPVLITAGDRDRLVEPDRLRTGVPDARLAMVPGGHYPFLDCPDVLRETVARFLRQVEHTQREVG